MSVTIYRRDGTVAFVADRATTTREAVEQASKSGADLTRADLSDADLTDANLTRAYLSGAYLTRADLSDANLSGADLTRAYLSDADLTDANLTRANLSGADLTGADLSGAYLTRANLTRADLSGAYLTGANLTGANLYGANLYGAVGVYYATIGPVDGWMVALRLTDDGLRVSAGCRYFSFPEAREHWSDPGRWSVGASPEHGAKMLAAVNALLALAADWPEKLLEVSR